MKAYHVPIGGLERLFAGLEGWSVFAPTKTRKLGWLDGLQSELSLQLLRQPRTVQSPKGFLLPPSESLGRYGSTGSCTAVAQMNRLLLLGVRACELRALRYLDKVMLEGLIDDPVYRARREAMTIVSCDCTECSETCFCTLVGGQPFASRGYDVNLTPLDNGWIIEVATDRGRELLAHADLTEATAEQLAEREMIRRDISERVRAQNAKFTFAAEDGSQPRLPAEDDQAWQKFAADCVECGACTNICPTCHCFYLYDQALGAEGFERVRNWDSCLFGSYHRMAGGANMKLTPRPKLRARLANRVLHKFTYSPQQYELLGCVGCGRCVEGCLGAIDIRDVLQELSG